MDIEVLKHRLVEKVRVASGFTLDSGHWIDYRLINRDGEAALAAIKATTERAAVLSQLYSPAGCFIAAELRNGEHLK